MKWLTAALLCVVAGFATAQAAIYKIHLSWVAPATRADGTPLSPSELQNYTLLWTCDTGRTGSLALPLLPVTVDLVGTWLGQCIFTMTATDTAGRTSVQSNPVKVLIKLNKPAAGGMKNG